MRTQKTMQLKQTANAFNHGRGIAKIQIFLKLLLKYQKEIGIMSVLLPTTKLVRLFLQESE